MKDVLLYQKNLKSIPNCNSLSKLFSPQLVQSTFFNISSLAITSTISNELITKEENTLLLLDDNNKEITLSHSPIDDLILILRDELTLIEKSKDQKYKTWKLFIQVINDVNNISQVLEEAKDNDASIGGTLFYIFFCLQMN